MRVCYISGEYPPLRGGVADYTQRLTHAVSEKGAKVSVITSRRAARASTGVDPFPVQAIVGRWWVGSWGPVARWLERSAAEIAHIQYQTGAYGMSPGLNLLPLWLRRRLPQCRLVTTFHDLKAPYLFPKAGRLRGLANRILMRGSHCLVFVTEEDLAQAREDGLAQPVTLIPIGPNLLPPEGMGPREEGRTRWGVGPEDTLVGYFGFVTPSKGVETLLLALRFLRDRGMRVSLLMIGGERSDTETTPAAYPGRVRSLVTELGLGSAVGWTGYAPPQAISTALSACDLAVLPFQEGASPRHGSLMAVIAHGLPLVTTAATVNPWARGVSSTKEPLLPWLKSGENCLLVAPGNVVALAEAIANLARSAELRRRLSQGALRLAANFSWPTIAEKHLTLYRQILEQRR